MLVIISKMLTLVVLFGTISLVVSGVENNFINFGGFVCPREEIALGRCLRDALNLYIPQLAQGVPEFGVPPCEPLIIPTLSVNQSTGPFTVMSTFSNVNVTGPSTMRVKEVLVDSKEHEVIAMLRIPELKMRGLYKLSGSLLVLPIEGEGSFGAKYGDIDAIVRIKLGREPRLNDVDALSCEKLEVTFRIGYASMKLDNLFGSDGELGKTVNQFLNDNWLKLAEEMQVPMEEALRDFLKPLADHSFGTLKADDILTS